MGLVFGPSARLSACTRTATYIKKRAWMAGLTILLVWASASVFRVDAETVEVPVVNGNLGPCMADFTVMDATNKPLYDAKVHVIIRYGFMSKRKTDLEVGTNSEGKARLAGLPKKVKNPPLEFHVAHSGQSKIVTADPAADCHPSFTVALGTP
jgi:hypothetical protein